MTGNDQPLPFIESNAFSEEETGPAFSFDDPQDGATLKPNLPLRSVLRFEDDFENEARFSRHRRAGVQLEVVKAFFR